MTWSQADSSIDPVHEVGVPPLADSVPKPENTHRTSVRYHRITPRRDRLIRTSISVMVRFLSRAPKNSPRCSPSSNRCIRDGHKA